VSAVTLSEIQRGIALTQNQNPAKGNEVMPWTDRLAATHHILPTDAQTFRRWARLMHRHADWLFKDACWLPLHRDTDSPW